MFSPGDTVVYRHHVCEVTAIHPDYFDGNDYVELHALFEKSLKLFVAMPEAKPPTLRPIMSHSEALALIDSIAGADAIDEEALKTDADTPTLLERRIKEEYDKHLKTFSPDDLVPIIKSVRERTLRREDAGRQMTATDKKYFDLAESLLGHALPLSLAIPRGEVRDFLVTAAKAPETTR